MRSLNGYWVAVLIYSIALTHYRGEGQLGGAAWLDISSNTRRPPEAWMSVRTTDTLRRRWTTRALARSRLPWPGLKYQADTLVSTVRCGRAAIAVATAMPISTPPCAWPRRLVMCGASVTRLVAGESPARALCPQKCSINEPPCVIAESERVAARMTVRSLASSIPVASSGVAPRALRCQGNGDRYTPGGAGGLAKVPEA